MKLPHSSQVTAKMGLSPSTRVCGQCCFAAAFVVLGVSLPVVVVLLGPRLMAPVQTLFQTASAAIPSLRGVFVAALLVLVAGIIVWSLICWRSESDRLLDAAGRQRNGHSLLVLHE